MEQFFEFLQYRLSTFSCVKKHKSITRTPIHPQLEMLNITMFNVQILNTSQCLVVVMLEIRRIQFLWKKVHSTTIQTPTDLHIYDIFRAYSYFLWSKKFSSLFEIRMNQKTIFLLKYIIHHKIQNGMQSIRRLTLCFYLSMM